MHKRENLSGGIGSGRVGQQGQKKATTARKSNLAYASYPAGNFVALAHKFNQAFLGGCCREKISHALLFEAALLLHRGMHSEVEKHGSEERAKAPAREAGEYD